MAVDPLDDMAGRKLTPPQFAAALICRYRSPGQPRSQSSRRAARAVTLTINQSNDIRRKVHRVANDRRLKHDRGERRFGQRHFNRDEKFTAFRRDLPPARLSQHVAA